MVPCQRRGRQPFGAILTHADPAKLGIRSFRIGSDEERILEDDEVGTTGVHDGAISKREFDEPAVPQRNDLIRGAGRLPCPTWRAEHELGELVLPRVLTGAENVIDDRHGEKPGRDRTRFGRGGRSTRTLRAAQAPSAAESLRATRRLGTGDRADEKQG